MKRWAMFVSALTILTACASPKPPAMTVATTSGTPGDGQTVTFKGDALALEGTAIKVGDTLPSAVVTSNDLKPVNLAETKGKVRIISLVPSIDTPVCEEQTHELSEKNGGLDKQVELITVSMDLPFAQKRFAKEAKINNVTFLSDYKSAEFAKNTGLLIQPLHLLARTVLVVDKDNVIRYMQVVPEITNLPDMQAAMKAAKGLV
ncbi:MAG TPA: thiol peroxidase [Nitrospiria bacterium]|nr:thiol peroxidase [Nitrospiria bacterium]